MDIRQEYIITTVTITDDLEYGKRRKHWTQTRSTPVMQTSAMPSFGSMEQSSQSCKSQANHSLCHSDINFHENLFTRYSVMLLKRQKIERNPVSLKCACSIFCNMLHILKMLWISTHPFFHNVAKRHDATKSLKSRKLSSHVWDSLAHCFFNYVWYMLNSLWKSDYQFLA